MKDGKNIATYWGNIQFSEKIYPHERNDFFPILSKLAEGSDKILEIGVGDGRLINNLININYSSYNNKDKNKFFVGLDFTDKINNVRSKKVKASAFHLPFDDATFDLVYSTGMIEHYNKSETLQLVQEHSRVVKSGGYVMVKTPLLGRLTARRFLAYLRKKEYLFGSFKEVRGRNLTFKEVFHHFRKTKIQITRWGIMSNRFNNKNYIKNSLLQRYYGEHLYVYGRKTD